jgi:hypothetical protein
MVEVSGGTTLETGPQLGTSGPMERPRRKGIPSTGRHLFPRNPIPRRLLRLHCRGGRGAFRFRFQSSFPRVCWIRSYLAARRIQTAYGATGDGLINRKSVDSSDVESVRHNGTDWAASAGPWLLRWPFRKALEAADGVLGGTN